MHDIELERPIMGVESCFPFISVSYADQVVGTVEVQLGEGVGGVKLVKQVGDEWQWVMVLLGDTIKTMIVHS